MTDFKLVIEGADEQDLGANLRAERKGRNVRLTQVNTGERIFVEAADIQNLRDFLLMTMLRSAGTSEYTDEALKHMERSEDPTAFTQGDND